MIKDYPSYTKSNIAWIPNIPTHWKIKPLKQIFKILSGATPRIDTPEYWDGDIIWVTPADYKTQDKYIWKGSRNITAAGYFSCSTNMIPRGSVIFSKRAPIGTVAINDIDLCTNQGCLSCIPGNNISAMYYYYLMSVFTDVFEMNASGTTFKEISASTFGSVKFPVPPRDEQEQIIRFLDWKISEIHKLISIHKKEISLLDALKDTLIDKTVIMGINSSETRHCKDSRWDIHYPKHWKIQRMRESFTFRKGLSITKENLEESGLPVISYGQIHAKDNSGVSLHKNLIRYVSESYLASQSNALVEYGDFIFADTSEDVAGCGNFAYVDWQETIFAGYHTIIAHPSYTADHKYLAYLFRSAAWRDQIRKKVNGVKVYSITQRLLKDAFILLPPVDEQRVITAHLDEICSKINTLIEKIHCKINHLQHLKPCLISDVVTGKIDVRHIEIPHFDDVPDDTDAYCDDAAEAVAEEE